MIIRVSLLRQVVFKEGFKRNERFTDDKPDEESPRWLGESLETTS